MAGLLQNRLLHKAAFFPGLSLLFSTVGSKRTLSIGGVYPPIATPFEKGDEQAIAWKHLRENLTKWNQVESLRGYLVQGSNGEYCYLTTQERIEMISKVRQWSSKDKLVLAGSGMESTAATIEMTLAMAEAGADAAVVITPCYFKNRMTNEALVSHFTAVADKSSIPIILYSVPANTGLDLSVEVVSKLAKHSNIIGIKDSGGDVTKNCSYGTRYARGQAFFRFGRKRWFLTSSFTSWSRRRDLCSSQLSPQRGGKSTGTLFNRGMG